MTIHLFFFIPSFIQSCGHLFIHKLIVEHLLHIKNWGRYKEDMACSKKKKPLVQDSELKRLYNFCNEYMKGDEVFIQGRK